MWCFNTLIRHRSVSFSTILGMFIHWHSRRKPNEMYLPILNIYISTYIFFLCILLFVLAHIYTSWYIWCSSVSSLSLSLSNKITKNKISKIQTIWMFYERMSYRWIGPGQPVTRLWNLVEDATRSLTSLDTDWMHAHAVLTNFLSLWPVTMNRPFLLSFGCFAPLLRGVSDCLALPCSIPKFISFSS